MTYFRALALLLLLSGLIPAWASPDGDSPAACDLRGHRWLVNADRCSVPPPVLEKRVVTKCKRCPRDEYGKIRRSRTSVLVFAKRTGFPGGRRGWVVDHIVPLACGGKDAPDNMAWQTKAEAKAKDRWEGMCELWRVKK